MYLATFHENLIQQKTLNQAREKQLKGAEVDPTRLISYNHVTLKSDVDKELRSSDNRIRSMVYQH